jgi:hypothetical protein
MTEQPYDGGDLSYDSAHDAHPAQQPHPPHLPPPDERASAEPPAELSGDYSYDLAHDVPRG